MAKHVYTVQEIALQDGRSVTLKPLPIARLREFMDAWNQIAELKEGDTPFSIYVNCVAISLKGQLRDKFDFELVGEDGEFTEEYREYLEENVDLETATTILEVCGGLQLRDPKVREAAQRALDGLNST